jgi:uncharacterized protein (TIGR03437 family)
MIKSMPPKFMLQFLIAFAAYAATPPSITAIVNSATFVPGPVAAGSIATIFGFDFTISTALASGPTLPTNLGGLTVYVDGVASPVWYVSPRQINFQIPWEIAGRGQVSVVIISGNTVSNELPVTVSELAPGLYATALLSATAQPVTLSDANSAGGLDRKPRAAYRGEFVTFYATGLGPVENTPSSGKAPDTVIRSTASPTVTIGTVNAMVAFAGLAVAGPNPYLPGIYQVIVRVPEQAPSGAAVPVVLSVGGKQSNTVTLAIQDGRGVSLAKWIELGDSGAVIARAVTSQNTCPDIVINSKAQPMTRRAEPTLPLWPVLSCETLLPSGAASVSIEEQALRPPVDDLERITVVGDTGCRMEGPANFQSCNDAVAWPVFRISDLIATTKAQLLIHNGDFHYRRDSCPPGNAGCAGSPWGFNWDTWRADFFEPFQSSFTVAPWIFVRGNHETCDLAGEGWFRFLDPHPMPSSCQAYTDPVNIKIGQFQVINLDASFTDDTNIVPDQVKAYAAQFDTIRQITGPNAWLVLHRPLWGIRSNLNSNVGLQQASNNSLPAGIQLVISGHTHLFQTYSFAGTRASQVVIGNSGDTLTAQPTIPIVGAILGDAPVTRATSLSHFGFTTITSTGLLQWVAVDRDTNGAPVTACNIQQTQITCDK